MYLTTDERLSLQKRMLREGELSASTIEVWRHEDGMWSCDVHGFLFDSYSLRELLQELTDTVGMA